MEKWQKEWAYNKYWIMARSQQNYNRIRTLAKNNNWTSEKKVEFDKILFETENISPTKETLTNVYQHVWGYFKKISTSYEHDQYKQRLASLNVDNDRLGPFLKMLTNKYQISYLLESRLIIEMS